MFIKLSEAKKYHTAGKAYAEMGFTFERAWTDLEGDFCEWNAMKAFEIGFRGLPLDVKEYQRYGEVTLNRYSELPVPSYNFMDQQLERGVSVITYEWRHTIPGMFYAANAEAKNKPLITLQGIDTGYTGGDGEPLILPIETS